MREERQVSVRKRRRVVQDEEEVKDRCQFPELEAAIIEWLTSLRRDGMTANGDYIKTQAKKLFHEVYPQEDPDNFKASNGWLQRFTVRHKLTFRSVNSLGQKLPKNAKVLAEQFLCFVREKLQENKITDMKNIANMDESPLWFDLPSTRTYDFRGVKTVKSKTTGHEKLRYTVVLSGLGDGTKLKPMIIFQKLEECTKGQLPERRQYPSVKRWVNDKRYNEYMEERCMECITKRHLEASLFVSI
jgi:hypothetical protein